jgi:effector-binding domain-containing protein
MIPSRFLLPLCCAALMAAGPETPVKFLENPTCLTGPAAIQTFAEGTFFHLTAQATQHNLAARMKELVPQLQKALVASGVAHLGPMHVVYHGMGVDPDQPFDLEVGVLVPKGTEASAGGRVRTLAAFTCATTVFTGPFTMVGKVYQTLYPALMASGKVPLPESRQMILFWEGETSSNNMLLIQIGVQKQ